MVRWSYMVSRPRWQVWGFDCTMGFPGEGPREVTLVVGTWNPTGVRGKAERMRQAATLAARDRPWVLLLQEHHLLVADAVGEAAGWRAAGGGSMFGPVQGGAGGDRRRVSGGVGFVSSALGLVGPPRREVLVPAGWAHRVSFGRVPAHVSPTGVELQLCTVYGWPGGATSAVARADTDRLVSWALAQLSAATGDWLLGGDLNCPADLLPALQGAVHAGRAWPLGTLGGAAGEATYAAGACRSTADWPRWKRAKSGQMSYFRGGWSSPPDVHP